MDFSKAFDAVDHVTLINRLSAVGVAAYSTVLLELYLKDQKLFCRI